VTSSGERIWNCRQSDEQVAEKLRGRMAQSQRGGLDKLVAKSDVTLLTFGELAEKYLSQYPFNKQSTRELCEQIVRNLLMPKWSEEITVEIDPPKLKAWLVALDVESSTRGKYKSIMSGVYNWRQFEGLIARGEQFNPCRYVKGREFSQVTGYEALALEIEDTLKVLSELKQPEYELALLVATCGLRISEALGTEIAGHPFRQGAGRHPSDVRPSRDSRRCQDEAVPHPR
jgi:hypothetical protein